LGSACPGFLGALDCIVIPKGGRTKMVLGIYTKVNNNREKKKKKRIKNGRRSFCCCCHPANTKEAKQKTKNKRKNISRPFLSLVQQKRIVLGGYIYIYVYIRLGQH
jgi:hypothetical protein